MFRSSGRSSSTPRRSRLTATGLSGVIGITAMLVAPAIPVLAAATTTRCMASGDVTPAIGPSSVAAAKLTGRASASGSPELASDIDPTGSSEPEHLTDVNGRLFFAADDGTHGIELWKSSGTPLTTKLLKDIDPSGDSRPAGLFNVNGTLYFSADQGAGGGRELWKSNGTPSGTIRVKDINPTGDSSPKDFAAIGSTLYFSANDGVHGRELWKTDGTGPGTVMVRDVHPGFAGSDTRYLATLGSRVYFAAYDAIHSSELWSTDGTASGTKRVKDLSGETLPQPFWLTVVGDKLFVDVTYGGCAEVSHLWVTDGTPAGTLEVSDQAMRVVGFQGKAYGVYSGGHRRLWSSDGTLAGSGVVRPRILTDGGLSVVAGKLAFEGDDGLLWTTDGTAAGSRSLGVHPVSCAYSTTADIGDTTYFINGAEDHVGLWSTDGTPEGTVSLSETAHLWDQCPFRLTASGGQLYFLADDGIHGHELWRYVP